MTRRKKKKPNYEFKDRTTEINKSKIQREKGTQLQRHRDKENIKQSNNYIKYKWTNYSKDWVRYIIISSLGD